MKTFDTHELAWCAGFFDGEGSTIVKHSINQHGDISLRVGQKDKILLDRFQIGIGGYGNIYFSKQFKPLYGKSYSNYQLAVGKFEEIQYIMCLLWTWLGPIKKAQYKRIITYHLSGRRKLKNSKLAKKLRMIRKFGSKAMRNKKLREDNNNGKGVKLINPFTRE